MRKKMFLVFLLCMFSIGLFASGQKGETTETSNDPVITLRVAWWTNEVRTRITNDIFNLYVSQNPNVVIEPEFAGWGGYWDKLAVQAASGSLTDIIQMDLGGYLPLYVEKEQILDLTPYVKSGLLDLSNIDQGLIESATIDGKLYGVPLGSSPQAAVVNPRILAEAGLSVPEPGYTWEDYEEMGEKLAAKGYYLDSFQTNNMVYEFEYYARSYGEEYFDSSGQFGFSKDTLANYLSMKKRLTEKNIIPNPGILRQHQELENSLLVTKKAAIFSDMWASQLGAIESAAGEELVLIARPVGTQSGMYNKPAMYWSLTSDAVNPEEAVKFMNFWVNDIEANKIGLTNRGMPGSSDVRAKIADILDPASVKVVNYVAQVSDSFGDLPPQKPVQGVEISELFNRTVEEVVFDQISVAEATDKFLLEAKKILNK